ncbi:putative membrane domain protein [Anaplasma phagocytophilum str. CRT53-1]|uniref:Putative membrane domain protein n=1 Tax=Anaplasma phagocytophilum str. CRT53-1 TaxID=1359157 RepID=A0A0F3Q6G0_ANAPH|nr:putative membrane domain protein [Anaplasma phagocytophilum str. CRT53-1]
MLPVPFLYIANNMQGRRRVAAVLQRTGVYLEVFLENFILFSLFFTVYCKYQL